MTNGIRKYRPDIDGLRAIAVIAVIIYHAFPSLMPGGFVGVDVFFVISGYLITGIIWNELKEQRFSILHFYIRRIRRILPALILMILTVWIIGYFVLLPVELSQLGRHLIASATFTSNIRLLKESGYFDQAAELKPLLHLWSLAVEEQFYIFWPLLLWAVHTSKTRHMKILLGLLFLGSIGWCFAHQGKPENFYVLQSRFWELMIGAGLVGLNQRTKRSLKYFSLPLNGLSLFGFLLLIAGIALISKTIPFPGPVTLVPTLGCAILIISEGAWINKKILSPYVMRGIGKISYPLYLWHWPLLVYLRISKINKPSFVELACTLGISVILAITTYLFIERPIQSLAGIQTWSPKRIRLIFLYSGLAALASVAILGMTTKKAGGFPSRYNYSVLEVDDEYQGHLMSRYRDHKICAGIRSSQKEERYCSSTSENSADAILIGDSLIGQVEWGLMTSDDRTHHWLALWRPGCPPVSNIKLKGELGEKCLQSNEAALTFIERHPEIKLVILSPVYSDYLLPYQSRTSPGRVEAESASPDLVFQTGYENTIQRIQKMGRTPILMGSAPYLPYNPRTCLRFSDRFNSSICDRSVIELTDLYKKSKSIVSKLLSRKLELRYFDPEHIFCSDSVCPYSKNSRSLYFDREHLSIYGSELWSKAFISWLNDVQATAQGPR